MVDCSSFRPSRCSHIGAAGEVARPGAVRIPQSIPGETSDLMTTLVGGAGAPSQIESLVSYNTSTPAPAASLVVFLSV